MCYFLSAVFFYLQLTLFTSFVFHYYFLMASSQLTDVRLTSCSNRLKSPYKLQKASKRSGSFWHATRAQSGQSVCTVVSVLPPPPHTHTDKTYTTQSSSSSQHHHIILTFNGHCRTPAVISNISHQYFINNNEAFHRSPIHSLHCKCIYVRAEWCISRTCYPARGKASTNHGR